MSLFTTKITPNPPSLRIRYISLSMILGFVVMTIVLFFYSNIISTKQLVTDEVNRVHKKLIIIDSINRNLTETHDKTYLFLQDPSYGNYSEEIQQHISHSIASTAQITEIFQSQDSSLSTESKNLKKLLKSLSSTISDLTDIRMDVNRQYPGLALSANVQSIPQQAVTNNLQILIDEIVNDEFKPISSKLYSTLLKSQILWTRHISQLRIYFANRLASFSNNILVTQLTSLFDLNAQFLNNIKDLKTLYANEDSFESDVAIESILSNTAEWISILKEIREINESDNWRGDTYIMKTMVIPLMSKIKTSILLLEDSLLSEENIVTEQLKKASETLKEGKGNCVTKTNLAIALQNG